MLSRTTRIKLLLFIDVIFFFVELIVGYALGSLALISDSFHMLNDVLSLLITLYAIKLTAQDAMHGRDVRYSYGFHRAEILAALINGVFLLALCFSIFLEAVERFFSTPEIRNPQLVVLVGSLGLASNIVGLFLFHEHGHSHGSHDATSRPPSIRDQPMEVSSGTVTPTQKVQIPQQRPRSHSRSQSGSLSLYGHPAATRATMVQTANELASTNGPASPREHRITSPRQSLDQQPMNSDASLAVNIPQPPEESREDASETSPLVSHRQDGYNSHSRAHGSMNMRALLLHVFGDALGNVGVISTGLVIWLTHWSFKYYFDPIISLVITAIIFSSALPLVRSTSFILLQGVPPGIDLEEVDQCLRDVNGVVSLHELHVWQLSETKIVASVHVIVSKEHDFMSVAGKIQQRLHHLGIHSSTIQPEFLDLSYKNGGSSNENGSVLSERSCMIACPADQTCDPYENSCCPPLPSGP